MLLEKCNARLGNALRVQCTDVCHAVTVKRKETPLHTNTPKDSSNHIKHPTWHAALNGLLVLLVLLLPPGNRWQATQSQLQAASDRDIQRMCEKPE
jgi:hypothetical protein